ncbi:alkylated DNA repair protein ALKBH6 homolog isoform X4 [Rosa rugosa]|uniref:alkylated DNA repair protein ALKBH6 homolog isoform X4 n=1 Tax=Rosa rugosa TaxID=74645 RepID=UPI002B416F27|nr:alkylated DNA repair protein ALKBH6 homolog isoform X4 [Rosa rugosa]
MTSCQCLVWCCLNREMEGNQALNNFKVGSLPTLIYIPDFITENEETILLKNIYDAPVSKWKSLKNRRLQNWGGVVHEKGLISQDLPSWLTKITCRIYEESGLFPSPINHVLINEYLPNQGIMDGPAYYPVVAILSLGSPVVMNFTPHSRLTLGAGTCTHNALYSNSDVGLFKSDTDKSLDEHHPFPVLLMPRSLLIFKDKAYSDYLHAINDSEVHSYDKVVNEAQARPWQGLDHPSSQLDGTVETLNTVDLKSIHRTTTRVSLTCRLVLKVHKNLFRF